MQSAVAVLMYVEWSGAGTGCRCRGGSEGASWRPGDALILYNGILETHPTHTRETAMKHIIALTLKAQYLKRQLGYDVAAGYLRNRGFSLEKAREILL